MERVRADAFAHRATLNLLEIRAQKVGDKTKAPNRRLELMQAAQTLYRHLLRAHSDILDGFIAGDAPRAMAAVSRIPRLEKRIEELTGSPPKRSWLTLEELEQARRDFYPPKQTDPHALPFAKAQWKGARPRRPAKKPEGR